ncbi:DoxX family protein [Allokutzneria oryzae]|uniref:DoxX family protein n=1 Tax=Allokutzneria oryzae TaxID=1378989 RepID=A0ABV5ZR47_9PSEU
MSKSINTVVLSLSRAVLGLLFACHGAASLFGVLGGAGGRGGAVAFGVWPGWFAAVIQLVGGALVLIGLATRPAAIICSGSMAYAYFVSHQPKGLFPIENGGVPSALYCWFFLLIAVIGPGKYALDTWLATRRTGADEAVPAAA